MLQGSILGPVLFIYYINDIPTDKNTKISIFAVDTAVFSSLWKKYKATEYIQNHLNTLLRYYHRWKLKNNASKTEFIVFSKRKKKKKENKIKITIDGVDIEMCDNVKYLGLIMDHKLNYGTHIDNACTKGQKVTGLLNSPLNKNSKLNIKNKTILYRSLVRPVALYAIPEWSYANLIKILRFESKILRRLVDVPPRISNKKIRQILQISNINDTIFGLTHNFYNKQINNANALKNFKMFTNETKPFKIKHNLPYSILMS